jgi:hypothetical protein
VAGIVRADHFHVPGVTVADVVARECPVTEKYGEVCQRYDPHTGIITWCPFMYGLRISQSGHDLGEARTPKEAALWMAAAEAGVIRRYSTMCLRAPSTGILPGAARPRR